VDVDVHAALRSLNGHFDLPEIVVRIRVLEGEADQPFDDAVHPRRVFLRNACSLSESGEKREDECRCA
jgi:hypothetical protein